MKSSDEGFDAESLLKDLVEIIDESPTTSTTSTSASQLYLNWPTGSEILASASADWPATRHQPEVVGRQPETEIAAWSGATESDVTVALRDYTGGFSASGITSNPMTWEAVFKAEPAASLNSVCLLPPEHFDVNCPGFVAPPPATDNHGDGVAMTTQATQGILLHPCDKLDDSLDVFDLDLDARRPMDIRSTTPLFTLLTLNPPGVWPIAPVTQNVIELSTPALPLNVPQQLQSVTSEMGASLGDVDSGKNRLCSRCLSDSEVQLSGKASPLLTRQGSKRLRKGTGAPGVRGRSTSEAGPSRTEDGVEVDDFRLHRRREQNRRAARVCRERKRAMSTSMVKEYQDLLSSNTSLRFEIRQLQQEEQSLQTVLEKHLTTCTTLTSLPLTSSTLTSSVDHRTETSDDTMTSDDLL